MTGLEKIIEGRQDTKAIGFGAEVASKEEQNVGELFKQVMPEDLIRYGLIPGVCRTCACSGNLRRT